MDNPGGQRFRRRPVAREIFQLLCDQRFKPGLDRIQPSLDFLVKRLPAAEPQRIFPAEGEPLAREVQVGQCLAHRGDVRVTQHRA